MSIPFFGVEAFSLLLLLLKQDFDANETGHSYQKLRVFICYNKFMTPELHLKKLFA